MVSLDRTEISSVHAVTRSASSVAGSASFLNRPSGSTATSVTFSVLVVEFPSRFFFAVAFLLIQSIHVSSGYMRLMTTVMTSGSGKFKTTQRFLSVAFHRRLISALRSCFALRGAVNLSFLLKSVERDDSVDFR